MTPTPPLNSTQARPLSNLPSVRNKRGLDQMQHTTQAAAAQCFVDYFHSDSSVSPRNDVTPRAPNSRGELPCIARPPSTRGHNADLSVADHSLKSRSGHRPGYSSRRLSMSDSDSSSNDFDTDQHTSEEHLNILLQRCNGDIRCLADELLPRSSEIRVVSLDCCLQGLPPGEHCTTLKALFARYPNICTLNIQHVNHLSGACLDAFSQQRTLENLNVTGSLRVLCELPDQIIPLSLRTLKAADLPLSAPNYHIDDNVLNKICCISELELLDISYSMVKNVNCLLHLFNLHTLIVRGCKSLDSESWVSISNIKKLEELNVIETRFSESDLKTLLENAKALKTIYISRDQISQDVLNSYEQIRFFDENKSPIKMDSMQKRVHRMTERALSLS